MKRPLLTLGFGLALAVGLVLPQLARAANKVISYTVLANTANVTSMRLVAAGGGAWTVSVCGHADTDVGTTTDIECTDPTLIPAGNPIAGDVQAFAVGRALTAWRAKYLP